MRNDADREGLRRRASRREDASARSNATCADGRASIAWRALSAYLACGRRQDSHGRGGSMHEGLMVSVSGVRGRVGEALTPEVVATFAAGFGAWASARGRGRTIVVGRDSRVSGPMFHRGRLAALQSV